MIRITKGIVKFIIIVLIVFLVSAIVVNILKPITQRTVGEDYKEYISETDFQSDTVGTERIMCIDDNEEALLWRLRMIGAARESITMATFDLRMDQSGSDVMAALHEAAERGVKVRILIDGIYQSVYLRGNDTFYALCANENIEVRFYNPITLKNIYDVNYRMHDKYLMVDESMYLLGGRNTTETFLGRLHNGSNIDREILVYNTGSRKGESFQQLEDYFLQIWDEECVQEVSKSLKEEVLNAEYEGLRGRYQSLLTEYGDFEQFDDWYDSTWEADKITLVSNETNAENKEPRVLYTIEQLAEGAEEVIIQTPYVICNGYMYSVIRNIGKNADLNIMLNAVEKGSNPWGCTDYLNHKNNILSAGANVYEVMNEYAVHTKTVLIDDHLSIVGSYNLDMRSTYLDTELMLVVDSERLNSYIRDEIEQYKEKSIEVLSDGTETKGILYQEKELTAKKKAFYSILQIMIRPFRYLL